MSFEREEALLHGQYELTEVLGHGGFGLVLGGRHRDIDLAVAVKRIDASGSGADAGAQLRTEARVLAQLQHPHVVRVYTYASDGELHLLVMERLDGGTLRRFFHATDDRPVLDVCAAGVVVAAALDAVHTRNVVHRDVKPDNVLVGADSTFKIADFGIAKILGDRIQGASTKTGTSLYAAPEQLAGEPVTPATDVYSLGVTLFELLAGRPPFVGTDNELLEQHRHAPPPPLADTPAALAAIVTRAMAKDPAGRYQSGRELAVDLARATAHTYGPGWLARCEIPVHVDEEIRAATFEGRQRLGASGLRTRGPEGRTDTDPNASTNTDPTIRSAGIRGKASLRARTPDTPNTPNAPARGPEPSGYAAPRSATPDHAPPDLAPPDHTAGDRAAGDRAAPWSAFVVMFTKSGKYRALDAGSSTPRSSRSRRPTTRPAPIAVPDAHGLAVGPDGSVYVSQPARHVVLRIAPDGRVAPVLGTGEAGFSSDIGMARLARVDTPYGLDVGPDGLLYVADSGNGLIRRVDPDRDLVETVAGGGGRRLRPPPTPRGNLTVTPTLTPGELWLRGVRDVAVDPAGQLLIASTDDHCVLRVGPAGAELIAGCGQAGDSGDGGLAVRARLRRPYAVAAHPSGAVVVADTGNDRIRAVSLDGRINTVAGGRYQLSGIGGSPQSPQLSSPSAVAVRADGHVFVTCAASDRVFEVAAPHLATGGPAGAWDLSTGGGTRSGDAATRRPAALASPCGLAFWPRPDADSVTLVAESLRGAISVFCPDGTAGTLAVLASRRGAEHK